MKIHDLRLDQRRRMINDGKPKNRDIGTSIKYVEENWGCLRKFDKILLIEDKTV